MTDRPLCLGFTPEEFSIYVDGIVTHKMGAWRPRGVCLHNSYLPDLLMFENYLSSGEWTAQQLVLNWWSRYIKLGWRSGPHLFVARDKIWTGTALWTRGTHSPSFNATHWAVELIGDYDREVLPPELRANAVSAIADLYAMLGRAPNADNFKFHGEDPRTTHKHCPGKNVGPKADWIGDIAAAMHDPHEHDAGN